MFSLKRTKSDFTLLLFFAGMVILLQNASAQELPSSVRQRFTIFPAFRPCDPAQVKTFSLGRQPLEAILAQVTVENRSEKTIVAVKLRWNVYEQQEGGRVGLASCPPDSRSGEVFLTGTTDMIQFNVAEAASNYRDWNQSSTSSNIGIEDCLCRPPISGGRR